jgi:hypothetical protein
MIDDAGVRSVVIKPSGNEKMQVSVTLINGQTAKNYHHM